MLWVRKSFRIYYLPVSSEGEPCFEFIIYLWALKVSLVSNLLSTCELWRWALFPIYYLPVSSEGSLVSNLLYTCKLWRWALFPIYYLPVSSEGEPCFRYFQWILFSSNGGLKYKLIFFFLIWKIIYFFDSDFFCIPEIFKTNV